MRTQLCSLLRQGGTSHPFSCMVGSKAGEPICLLLPFSAHSTNRHSSQVTTAQSSIVLAVADLLDIPKGCRKMSGGPNFSKAQAVSLIEKLSVEERRIFLRELKKVDSRQTSSNKPTAGELKQLAYHNSLPFIGFGFLDNFIMIVAGEYIDLTLGAKLGISTMAAAALGNTLSDMMGIGSAWYVESWAEKLGATPPDLSSEQLEMTSCRVANNLGRALGVVFGCLLGMFPLLFIDTSLAEEENPLQEEKIIADDK